MRLRFPRPRYADVAATLALVFALSGTAYAVTTLPRNSVATRSIQHGAVTNPKIAANTIQSNRIKNDTLTGVDVAANSIGLADLVGANVRGAITFSLAANTCGTLNFAVGGASVGEAVIMSYTGTVALPPGVVFSPFRVVSTGNIATRACNVTGSSVSVSSIGVRFVTFG
jgi:hypothetical protein